VVANKADAAPAGAGADLAARLGVERLEGRAHRVQAASALSGSGVREGLQWLVEQARAPSPGSESVWGLCLGGLSAAHLSGGQHARRHQCAMGARGGASERMPGCSRACACGGRRPVMVTFIMLRQPCWCSAAATHAAMQNFPSCRVL